MEEHSLGDISQAGRENINLDRLGTLEIKIEDDLFGRCEEKKPWIAVWFYEFSYELVGGEKQRYIKIIINWCIDRL